MTQQEPQPTPAMHVQRADLMLDAARLLLAQGHYNSAVDRAYYAIYHAATAAVLQEGASPPTSHRGLRNVFGRLVIAPGQAPRGFATQLATVFELRQFATYDPVFLVEQLQADSTVTNAETFIVGMKRLLALP